MRITLMPNNVEEKEAPFECNEIYRFAFEFYEGSGNIHITETGIIEQVFDTIGGDVKVVYEDGTSDTVKDYNISSITGLDC